MTKRSRPAASPAKFTLNGKEINPKRLQVIDVAVKRILDKLPFGTLLDSQELGALIGRHESQILKIRDKKLVGYFVAGLKPSIWGSKESIAELEKSFGNNH